MNFVSKTVLITGGGSGIGKIMGRIALQKGAKSLIIWDINQTNIDKTINELSTFGSVCGYRVDVSNSDNVVESAKITKAECGVVDILIQCAGIVTGNQTFENQTISAIERTMKINSIAPMVVALQFIGDMLAQNEGHICNIASAAGMISNPKMSIYAASKWAVIGWSDSVRIELSHAKSNVHFTTVAPYYINTGMFDGVTSPIFPILDPEKVSKKIIRAIEKNKSFLGMPWSFHFIRLMQGILPTCMFDLIIGKVFGIFGAMDNFKGRK